MILLTVVVVFSGLVCRPSELVGILVCFLRLITIILVVLVKVLTCDSVN